jgi:hypothetical protein
MSEASISYDTPYVEPTPAFYSGAAISNLVPHPFPIAIAGHPYQIQWDHTVIGVWGAKFKQDSLPLLRAQADQSNTPGEQSISPEQFWRRSQETWHYGSGQAHLDRSNSELRRFYTSKGVDCWTPWKMELLNTTGSVLTSANSNLYTTVAGSYVYVTDGTTLKFSSGALSSWTTVTGTPSVATSIDTDGTTVYTTHNTSGVYSTTAGGASTASLATGTANLVRYTKGRIMVAGGTSLYNYTSGAALPTALLTKNAGWTWVDITGGQSQIYAAGYSGDKSLIYRTAIVADGTTLGAPIVAGELPDGEIVRSINAYLSYIIIGSDLGVRFCSVNSDGSLTIGSLITTTSPVYCSEGQDRFVWYGMSNLDTSSTGLGRMDLQTFTAPLTPAYASDIMATGQGAVRSVITFGNLRLFSVDGLGIFYETASTPVSSGTFTTGLIGYGISDKKVAVFFDLKHEPLHGTISVSLAADGRKASVVGTSTVIASPSPTNAFPTKQLLGEEFQITVTLTPTANVSPVLSRWTLRSYPVPIRTAQWNIPIMLFDPVLAGGVDQPVDVDAEYAFLVGLHKSQKIASLQIGTSNYQAVMYDYQWLPEKVVGNEGSMHGTFYAQFREIAG